MAGTSDLAETTVATCDQGWVRRGQYLFYDVPIVDRATSPPEGRKVLVYSIVFKCRLRGVPLVGLSSASVDDDSLEFNARDDAPQLEKAVVLFEWSDVGLPDFADCIFEPGQCLRISFAIMEHSIGVRFRLVSQMAIGGLTSRVTRYVFPAESKRIYLALVGEQLVTKSTGRVGAFSMFNGPEYVNYQLRVVNGMKAVVSGNEPPAPDRAPENWIECLACMDRKVEVLAAPCWHAAICGPCVRRLWEAEANENRRVCIMCQQKVTNYWSLDIGRQNCLACGCATLEMAALHEVGTACLIGCALHVPRRFAVGGPCPMCGRSVTRFEKIFF